VHYQGTPAPIDPQRPPQRRRSPARAIRRFPRWAAARSMATVGNVTCWRRTRHDRRACGELARAAPVNAEAVDHQERGGATKREKPGANAEKGGSRAHAEQRCQATTEHCAENADQQSAYLRRFGVAGKGTCDPSGDNTQDHPSGEAHCAALFDDADHGISVRSPDRTHTMIDDVSRPAHTA
jgi:hypothetical protein